MGRWNLKASTRNPKISSRTSRNGKRGIEAAFWIAEEKRARLRGNPTEVAFARLAFQHCMQQIADVEFR